VGESNSISGYKKMPLHCPECGAEIERNYHGNNVFVGTVYKCGFVVIPSELWIAKEEHKQQ
jgi:predicted RNA-binding Zn-ribbon protein involved in translation (DUF1610 family)